MRNEIKEAKNKWIKCKAEEIEQNIEHNNTRKAYVIFKKLRGTSLGVIKKQQTCVIEDKDGTLLTKSWEICKR